jgi:hypothetical protein
VVIQQYFWLSHANSGAVGGNDFPNPGEHKTICQYDSLAATVKRPTLLNVSGFHLNSSSSIDVEMVYVQMQKYQPLLP